MLNAGTSCERPYRMSDRFGGRSRDRTYDPLIKSQLLYQLSYVPVSRFDDRRWGLYNGANPACPALLENFMSALNNKLFKQKAVPLPS